MAVFFLAEVVSGGLGKWHASAKAVTAARALGDVTVLCAGGTDNDAAKKSATINGVAKDEGLSYRLAEATADLIIGLASNYSHVVAPATTDAKNLLPRVAALLNVMVPTDVSGVVEVDTFERPIYAGNAIQRVKSPTLPRLSRSAPRLSTWQARAILPRWRGSPAHTRTCRVESRTRWRPLTVPC